MSYKTYVNPPCASGTGDNRWSATAECRFCKESWIEGSDWDGTEFHLSWCPIVAQGNAVVKVQTQRDL